MRRVLSLLLMFAATGWFTASAQSKATATVEVRDETGAVVSGAEVTVVATSPSQAPKIVSRTYSSGTVSFDLLPDIYDLSVKTRGFKDVSRQIVITDTKRETFPVVVLVGVCSPCVDVTGTPASEAYRPNYSEFLRLNGAIPDGDTAVAVAEAIFEPVFGKGYSAKFLPYHARFNGGVWTVYGTLKQGSRGGTPMLKIQKSDGKVLEVWHSQ
jgi:hypothetical protein